MGTTNITHESAEEMWESLGWACDYDDRAGGGQVEHPVCTVEQLDTLTDAEILAVIAVDCGRAERDAYESAIVYARAALADMRSIADSLDAAVDAYQAGDMAACIDALDSASREESEYGDDPAATALRKALIAACRADITGALSSHDHGDGCLGVIVDEALEDAAAEAEQEMRA